jgi:predicted ArsR family transcriptional regulator
VTRNGATSAGPSVLANDFGARVIGIACLAEPLRRALYRFVVTQAESVSREQAAAGVGVALHLAKFHLDKLVDDGLLDFEYRRPPDRRGPGAGRPAKLYRRSPREFRVSLPERSYELAAELLAQAITNAEHDGTPVAEALQRAAREAGLRLGETLASSGSDPRATVIAVLEESGYEPRTVPGGVLLANCPFHSLARDYTELACGMNFDLIRGLLVRVRGAKLDAKLDPGPDRCCVRLQDK